MTAAASIHYPRDYSLTGPEGRHAVEIGLAAAEWYHSDVPRKAMKDLMQRRDGPALRDTTIWIGLLACSGTAIVLAWGSWWVLPFLIVYGVLYGSACDSRWHECGHGTAFRTPWMNNVVYHLASFMVMRNPISWRWSHARHHTDTIIVGRDPEIALMRPPDLLLGVLHFVGIPDIALHFRVILHNAMGKVTAEECDYLPETERAKAIYWARIHVGIYVCAGAASIWMWSILPLVLIGGPRIYGCWHMVMTGLLQHGGLAEDVLDHRLNSRTVYMNPVSQWLYWNMNFHIEHHMFPMVPYHALPTLHRLIRDDLPAPNSSIFNAYGEMIGSLWRQRTEPGYWLRPVLPNTARPFREEFHDLDIGRGRRQSGDQNDRPGIK
jgi:fatty acid desaturase